MPNYFCQRCGWSTIIKTQIRNHFFRIKPCEPILSNITNREMIELYFPELIEQYEDRFLKLIQKSILNCKFCKKKFSSKQSRWFHEKSCSKIHIENDNLLAQQLKDKDEIIKIQQKEKEDLLKLVGELGKKSTINNSNNTTNSNNTNTTINVQINAFGNENLSYLSKSFLDSLLKIPYASIPKLLEEIHFNKKFPENQNIKIINRKEKWALKFNGKEWEFVPKNAVINDMIYNGVNILENHYDDNAKEELNDIKKEKWEQFTEEIHDEKTTTLKRLFDETECLILNNSNKNKLTNLFEQNPELDENIELIIDDDNETINEF